MRQKLIRDWVKEGVRTVIVECQGVVVKVVVLLSTVVVLWNANETFQHKLREDCSQEPANAIHFLNSDSKALRVCVDSAWRNNVSFLIMRTCMVSSVTCALEIDVLKKPATNLDRPQRHVRLCPPEAGITTTCLAHHHQPWLSLQESSSHKPRINPTE